MPDQHVLLPGRGERRPVLRDGRVHVQFSAVDQHQGRQAGHRLGRRPDVGDRVLLPRLSASLVAVASPQVDGYLAVEVEHDGSAKFRPRVHIPLQRVRHRAEALIALAL